MDHGRVDAIGISLACGGALYVKIARCCFIGDSGPTYLGEEREPSQSVNATNPSNANVMARRTFVTDGNFAARDIARCSSRFFCIHQSDREFSTMGVCPTATLRRGLYPCALTSVNF